MWSTPSGTFTHYLRGIACTEIEPRGCYNRGHFVKFEP